MTRRSILAGVLLAGLLASIALLRGPVAQAGSPRNGNVKGLHLPRKRPTNLQRYFTLNDGEGYTWRFQQYGNVYQGTNHAYSSGCYSQIDGSNISSRNGQGWLSSDGREFEIGPCPINQLVAYRRVRVYKDEGLCRWLDIIHNPTSTDIQKQVQVYSSFSYGIGSLKTNSGGSGSLGKKDFAFYTTPRHNSGTVPSVLHVVCGPKSDVKPSVQQNGSSLYVRYNVTIPAGKTIVLCYFEAQNRSEEALTKMMENFKPRKYLKDLSPAVRKLIVNFKAGWGFEGVELNRSAVADAAHLANGDRVHGTVDNERFTVRTFFGDVTLPASRVVGMQAVSAEDRTMLTLLDDGQVLCGPIPDQKLGISLASGGTLRIPFHRMTEWSFQITKERPDEIPFQGPFVTLRTGDRLAFDAGSIDLHFRTRYGQIKLDPEALLNISLDNGANTLHSVTYLNGSKLGGFLLPADISATLRVENTPVTITRNLVSHFELADEEKRDESLSHASLTNGDELFGEVDEQLVELKTDYGTVPLKPGHIKIVGFSPRHLRRAAVVLWNGSVLRGQLMQDSIRFRIAGGPVLDLYPNQCTSIIRSQTMPHTKILKEIETLVAQLGAESYADRQAATELLKKLGPGTIPLLKRFKQRSKDPEIRHRLESVLETLGAKSSSVENSTPSPDEVQDIFIPAMGNGPVMIRGG
ncbi:MAG: hypothetical protein ACOCZU_07410 [Planctomycetota bacterium]